MTVTQCCQPCLPGPASVSCQTSFCETHSPPAGWNVYHFCSPSLDAAERTALTSYDRTTRQREYARVQEIAAEGLPFLVLWYQRELDVVNTDLKNYRPAHAVTPFWNAWEWQI